MDVQVTADKTPIDTSAQWLLDRDYCPG